MEKDNIFNSYFCKKKLKNNRHFNRYISAMEWHKVDKNLHFKTIDDHILIDQLIADRNTKHLNQADGTPFTVEPLLSLVGKNTFTTFSQELLVEQQTYLNSNYLLQHNYICKT